MMRFAAAGIGVALVWLGASAPAAAQAVAPPVHRGSPVYIVTIDTREADLQEQRLELERQRAEAEERRAEAEDHRRRVEAQTPHGRPSTTSYTDLPVGNPLAGTDAPRCTFDNGSTIQVSGGLRGDGCQK